MVVKEKVYQLLFKANQQNKVISGQEIAETLKVSRTAVWKAVDALRKQGYSIDAKSNQGYWMQMDDDILSSESLTMLLPHYQGRIHVFNELESTSTLAKEWAQKSAVDKTVIIASCQTAGRGRLQRSFYSPEGGIYLSMILRPQLLLSECMQITICAALAVCKAVKKVCNLDLGIKWVNDLYLHDLKVAGILTEASADFESGRVEYVVVGIGLNLFFNSAIPEELRSIVTSLYGQQNPKNKGRLIAEIIGQMDELMKNPHDVKLMDEYRQRSILPGRQVEVLTGPKVGIATVVEVNAQGELVVEFSDHSRESLVSGEVSLKLVQDEK